MRGLSQGPKAALGVLTARKATLMTTAVPTTTVAEEDICKRG
jgi:hypothetical protein